MRVIHTRWLLLLMVAAVALTGAVAYWQEHQRSEDALEDLGSEQTEVARAAGLGIGNLLDASSVLTPAMVDQLRALEVGGVRVLVLPPGSTELQLLDGHTVAMPAFSEAVARGSRELRVERRDAPALGLPRRTAMVGIAPRVNGWTLAVAASAERQRDRDRAGLVRMMLSIVVAAGLVAAFGALARTQQRAQLELARELAVSDIARAKDVELEQMSRAATMAAIGSGIAHELSTPLGVIVGRAEQLLVRANGDERIAKNAQTIIDQADHVDLVVRGLLGLARGAPIALQETEPRRLVDEAAALVEHRFARANVKLVPVLGASLPRVRCEPLLFKHALINLLLNACDASPDGATVRLEITADAAEVAFIVTDDGEGIAPTTAARAIEPFFTTKPAGRGTGLGLAIANEIASTHRGSLAIAPTSPRGTRACITIPTGESHA
ncbi:MAG TPA: HAMP domain-containing sensor histidine kinase [Kofleriaceae bacterium]|jgi:signal transduction histidine kinase|nr:HAMP domain-containing sensor histidine kinase [Kofleriaceae bacterium]